MYFAKFCTLNSKYVHASLAPYYLAVAVNLHSKGNIKAVAYESTVKEASANLSGIVNAILTDKPKFIGFSCYIWNIEATLKLAKAIKEENADIVIALGGPEAGYNANAILNEHNYIEYVLSGEGEESVPELINCLYSGEGPQKGQISGLNTKAYSSKPCELKAKHSLLNPYTSEYLQSLKGRIAYIETSRNCPFNCAFCLSGVSEKPRYFSDEQIFENIVTLSNSMAKTVKFIDRTFNANTEHANKILRFIKENIGKRINEETCFHFEIAADILSESTMQILSEMPTGSVQLEIGMQSFNEKTLCAVNRKTNTQKLKENIKRLVECGNMHIHIDLIAGLPFEDIHSFKNSFNEGYALNANVMQLGFLKILHGSEMRTNAQNYPCTFNEKPPYEIINTPWLCEKDIKVLKYCEDALERLYNSGRFTRTAKYAIEQSGKTPFDFYCEIGIKANEKNIATHHVDLDMYTKFLYDILPQICDLNKDLLRDEMIRDRLATNAAGRIPKALQIKDSLLAKASELLEKNYARSKGVKRGVALLYGAQSVCFVDYRPENLLKNTYKLTEIPFANLGLQI